MNDYIDFKRSFTQKQEDAIWQYLLDHAKVQPNGYLGIMLYVKNVNDFWKRVFARYTGEYHRYEEKDIKNKQARAKSQFYRLHQEKIDSVFFQIDRQGSLKQKFLKYIYQKIEYYLLKNAPTSQI